MLPHLLLLVSLPLLVTSSYNEELIIERRPHHVDWEDLFMEYNRYSAPDRVRQEVNVTVDIIDFDDRNIIFELNQHWRDERLRFVGTSRVPVPSHIQPWYPDTYIRNCFDMRMDQKSLDLNYDGSFLLRQHYRGTLGTQFVIASFNNYGTEKIHYNLVGSRFESRTHELGSKQVARSFDGLHFEDLIIIVIGKTDVTGSESSESTQMPLENLVSNSTV